MVVCPEGHDSASNDFCDVCGTRIGGNPAPSLGRMMGKHHEQRPGVTNGGETCPGCGARVSGQFCEACGFDPRAHRPFAPLVPSADAFPSSGSSAGPPESLFPPVSRPDSLSSPWLGLEPQPPPWRPPDLSLASWSPPEPSPSSWSPPEPPPSSWSRSEPPAASGGRPGCHPPRPSSPPGRKGPDHQPSPRLQTCWHRYSHRPLLNRHSHSWLPSRRRPRLRPRSGWSRHLRSCSNRRPHIRLSLSRR